MAYASALREAGNTQAAAYEDQAVKDIIEKHIAESLISGNTKYARPLIMKSTLETPVH